MTNRFPRIALIVLGVLAVGFILLQLIPVNRTNPPVISEPNWDSPQTRETVERACFDCHSNQTEWPWYSYVAPMSWLVAKDVHDGREELNFSEWSTNPGDASDDIRDVLEDGEMPLPQYLLLHPEAQLTDAERQTLIRGLTATITGSPSSEDDDEDHRDEDDD